MNRSSQYLLHYRSYRGCAFCVCMHAQFIANMADDNDVVDVFDATMSDNYNETIDLPDGETDCRPKLSKLPNKKALVWKYFGFSSTANKDKPVCSICYENVLTKNSNTSNLYSHLKYKHPKEYLEVKPPLKRVSSSSSDSSSSTSQVSIVDAFEKCKVLSTTSREHKELTDAVARCLAKDCLPLYTVEKRGFVESGKKVSLYLCHKR